MKTKQTKKQAQKLTIEELEQYTVKCLKVLESAIDRDTADIAVAFECIKKLLNGCTAVERRVKRLEKQLEKARK